MVGWLSVVMVLLMGAIFSVVLMKLYSRGKAVLEAEEKKIAELEQRLREIRQIVEQERKELSERRMVAQKMAEVPTVLVENDVRSNELQVKHIVSGDRREPNLLESQSAAFAEADMAYKAFDRQCHIEAYFHGRLAQMMGHRQMMAFLSDVRISWKRMGYRSEKGLMHAEFGELQSAIGRAMIRIESKHDEESGYMRLHELAEGGNELAKRYLDELKK